MQVVEKFYAMHTKNDAVEHTDPMICSLYCVRNIILFNTYQCTNIYKTPKHSVFASRKTLKCMKKSGLKKP